MMTSSAYRILAVPAIVVTAAMLIGCAGPRIQSGHNQRLWKFSEEGGAWGLIDSAGRVVVEAQYRQITEFDGAHHVAQRDDGRWVLVDANNETKLYDGEDALVVVPLGDSLYSVVRDKGSQDLIDLRRDMSLPPEYFHYFGNFADGRLPVRREGKSGYCDRDGKIVIPAKYELCDTFSEGKAVVQLRLGDGSAWAVIDTDGSIVIDPMPEVVLMGQFKNDLAVVYDGESHWYITPEGEQAFPQKFLVGRDFSEGLAAVQDRATRRWGYIDHLGAVAIDFRFKEASDFSEGLAVVKDAGGEIGFIDTAGTMTIPLPYRSNRITRVSQFADGIAWVKLKGGDSGAPIGYYINRRGEIVWSNS